MHLFVTQHMKQRKLYMLNNFVCVGVIEITSAFVVVVLLRRLLVVTHLKNLPLRKVCLEDFNVC